MIYDIAVIGASTAGLYAAEILAKQGKKVAVFEQSETLAPNSRTYIITPGILRVLPDINPDLIRHKINEFHLQAGEVETKIKLASSDFTIDRSEMILDLAARAKHAGVELITGSKFLGLETLRGNTQVRIQQAGEEYLYKVDYLIGADGINSQVRDSVSKQKVPGVPLLQAEIDLPNQWDDSVTKVWFQVDDTPYFYWLIPDNNRKAVVGLIAEEGADIRTLLNSFLEKNHFQPQSYQSGKAALYDKRLEIQFRVGDLDVYLVGDAAGQVKVTTVGGTVTGLYGGMAAAEAILQGSSFRKAYQNGLRELGLHLFIRNLLTKMAADDYQRLIRDISPAVQSFLSRYDRDAIRRHFWKLALLQPDFIPLGLKLLFKNI